MVWIVKVRSGSLVKEDSTEVVGGKDTEVKARKISVKRYRRSQLKICVFSLV